MSHTITDLEKQLICWTRNAGKDNNKTAILLSNGEVWILDAGVFNRYPIGIYHEQTQRSDFLDLTNDLINGSISPDLEVDWDILLYAYNRMKHARGEARHPNTWKTKITAMNAEQQFAIGAISLQVLILLILLGIAATYLL